MLSAAFNCAGLQQTEWASKPEVKTTELWISAKTAVPLILHFVYRRFLNYTSYKQCVGCPYNYKQRITKAGKQIGFGFCESLFKHYRRHKFHITKVQSPDFSRLDVV